ncbi:hypothetical protein CLA18_21570 [Pseudomonas protegens]|nr:hypothetical protein BS644_16120 [Pseudomonas protegens]OKK54270.1 hypothetical protein BS645_31170 [Pseudomonas protegens]OKK63260.1 hypothetical protein BS646_04570 [Pseudomonas protegens]PNV96337.1 hypothetical protein C1633_20505 [Pseudomonas protegens]QEN48991.1 hypothetical protein CLA18_21570 [Pseudomonas protegens]
MAMRLILKRYFLICEAFTTGVCLQKDILLLSSPPLFFATPTVFISLKPSQKNWQKKRPGKKPGQKP